MNCPRFKTIFQYIFSSFQRSWIRLRLRVAWIISSNNTKSLYFFFRWILCVLGCCMCLPIVIAFDCVRDLFHIYFLNKHKHQKQNEEIIIIKIQNIIINGWMQINLFGWIVYYLARHNFFFKNFSFSLPLYFTVFSISLLFHRILLAILVQSKCVTV